MKRASIILGLAVLLCAAKTAQATTITYTLTTMASGSLGTTDFGATAPVQLTINFTTDTSTAHPHAGKPWIWQSGGASTGSTGTVTIEGLGTALLGPAVLAFDDQGGATHNCSVLPCEAGFGTGQPVGPTILATVNPAFLSYELKTDITASGATFCMDGSSPGVCGNLTVATDQGPLKLTSVGESTFTAVVSTTPIPEPGSLIFVGTGLVSLIGFARRRLS